MTPAKNQKAVPVLVVKRGTLEWKRNRIGWLYVLPWIIGFLAFGIVPMVASFNISLLKWDGLTDPEFVGLGNYIKLIAPEVPGKTSELFWRSIVNNSLFMIFSSILGLVLGFFMAAVMNEKIPGHKAFRVIFFLPTLVVPVAFGLMMQPIFMSSGGSGGQTGVLNWLIMLIGGQEVNFLGDPANGIWTVIFTSYWWVGGGMVIFMAGMAGIPPSYHEAAMMDGAGWWVRMFNITLPMLKPVIFFQIITALINGLRVFDLAASLAGMGGDRSNMGPNDSLATLVFFMYKKGWRDFRLGEAAAIGWIILILGLILTFIILWYLKRANKDDAAGEEV